jgi:tetratricopeptide (TPR) repeat protein
MLTEDYIMRLINQALAVLLTALGLKKAGKYKESLQTFDQAVDSLLGLNARLVDALDDRMLLDRLTFMGKLDIDRVQVLADIYREEVEVYQLLNQPEKSSPLEKRSLRLYLEAALASQADLNTDFIQKIEALRHKVIISELPVETHLALQDYLDRLLAMSDDSLGANGLSRPKLVEDSSNLESFDLS